MLETFLNICFNVLLSKMKGKSFFFIRCRFDDKSETLNFEMNSFGIPEWGVRGSLQKISNFRKKEGKELLNHHFVHAYVIFCHIALVMRINQFIMVEQSMWCDYFSLVRSYQSIIAQKLVPGSQGKRKLYQKIS